MNSGSIKKALTVALPIGCVIVATMFYQYLGLNVYLAQLLAVILTLSLLLVFIHYPMSNKFGKIIDKIFMGLAIVSGGYLVIYYPELVKAGSYKPVTIILGACMVLVILECTRRMFGKVLAGLVAVFAIYPLIGPFMPGLLQTRTYSISRAINAYYIEPNGILGVTLSVAITIVSIYFILGACFDESGATTYMSKLALRYFGRTRGGAAKVAVVCSGALGAICGNAASNVATTGVITIPLMKSTGYKASTSGAIEAVAATGGLIMPPVMGAAAFVMAEFLGMPYGQIVVAAIVPALLYYFSIFIAVDMEAASRNLKGLSKEEIPSYEEGRKAIYLIGIPVVILLITLVGLYMRPGFAGLATISSLIAVSFIFKDTRLTPKRIINALNNSVKSMLTVIIVCAAAGIIIGSVLLTGLGAAFVQGLFVLAGHSLFLALLLTAFACIILGMGMPAVGVYIILAMLVAPGLVALGSNMFAAHMFVFYFGIFSVLTPPVCLAVYVSCSIADSPLMETAIIALKLAFVAFFAPFVMIYNPAVLLQEGSTLLKISLILAMCVATVLTAIGINASHYKWIKRGPILLTGLAIWGMLIIV